MPLWYMNYFYCLAELVHLLQEVRPLAAEHAYDLENMREHIIHPTGLIVCLGFSLCAFKSLFHDIIQSSKVPQKTALLDCRSLLSAHCRTCQLVLSVWYMV